MDIKNEKQEKKTSLPMQTKERTTDATKKKSETFIASHPPLPAYSSMLL
jgi:hypothetical protein